MTGLAKLPRCTAFRSLSIGTLLLLIVLFHNPNFASADITIEHTSQTNLQMTNGIVEAIVNGGSDMVGMQVTVIYNTFTETRTWSQEAGNIFKGGVSSGAHAGSWQLFADVQGGNGQEGTFGDEDETLSDDGILSNINEHWEFKHDAGLLPAGSVLEALIINGQPAGIVFDRPVHNNSLIATTYNPTATPGDGLGLDNPRPHEGGDLMNALADASWFGTPSSMRGRDFFSTQL